LIVIIVSLDADRDCSDVRMPVEPLTDMTISLRGPGRKNPFHPTRPDTLGYLLLSA